MELDQLRLLHPGWRDALEIIVVAYALYRVMRMFHGTRGRQIASGVVVLGLAYVASWSLGLEMLEYLLGFVFQNRVLAVVIAVSPQLRAELSQLVDAQIGRVV